MCVRSEQRDTVRKPLYPYVAHHGNYMIPHLTYFPFLQSRTFTVRPCCNLPVFCSWDMGFSQKIMQDPLQFAPVLTNKLRGKIDCLRQKSAIIGNDGVSHKALRIMPALFHGWSTTRLLRIKNIRTLYRSVCDVQNMI